MMREREIRIIVEGRTVLVPVPAMTSDENAMRATLALGGLMYERDVQPWQNVIARVVHANGSTT